VATLTQTTFLTRRIIKYGSIGLVIFLILQFSFGVVKDYLKKHNPPAPPPPTVAFKKLPALDFPKKENLPIPSFSLQTISGSLPVLDNIGKVYVMIKPATSLLSLDKAKTMAKGIGFTDLPQPVSSQVYRFTTNSVPTTILELNIVSNNFTLRYEYAGDPNILTERKLPTNGEAINEAKSFLNKMGLLPDDISAGKSAVTYFKYSANGLISADSLSEADFVKVSLLRQDLDKLKIVPENPNSGPISFLFSGSRDPAKRILEINYTYSKIDAQHFATYPLKSVATAWQELEEGKGFVANLGNNSDGKIVVRDVYLAYYDSTQPQNYLQPIFVFEGDKGFLGYVSAIDPQWID